MMKKIITKTDLEAKRNRKFQEWQELLLAYYGLNENTKLAKKRLTEKIIATCYEVDRQNAKISQEV